MEEAARPRLHPLITVAAVAVTIFSAVGIAAITGLLPRSSGESRPALTAATSPAQPLAAPAVAAPAPAPVAAPAAADTPPPAPKPVKKAHAPKPAQPKPVQVAQASTPPSTDPALQPIPSTAPPPPPPAPAVQAKPPCPDCGVVESFREIEVKGEGTGAGAVVGGLAGAVIGNQIGRGNGRTVGTLLGAAGGAYAGNAIERNARTTKRYEVGVRMENGSLRTITYDSPPSWRAGDRVRFVNGQLSYQ